MNPPTPPGPTADTPDGETHREHDGDSAEVRVPVRLGDRSYEVRVLGGSGGPASGFGAFARGCLDASWAGRPCRRALIVTDGNVAPRAPAVAEALAGVGVEAATAVVPPGEASKSLQRAAELYGELIALRADRHTAVVALGGGVVGDLAGFVAATFARGLPLLMVPTSLLAQVDSSVGGKVGVNHPRCKNVVGAFHQPAGVWADADALDTLPARELRCGLAEVVKHGVILDAEFFAYQEAHAEALMARRPDAVRHAVAQSCRIKAGVVTRDEREETGLRAALNFGHTVGHAVESVAGYGGDYLHGEAVAVGMVAESRLAGRLGWVGPEFTDRLVALLTRLGLPTTAPGLDPDRLLGAMRLDKKNRGGRTRFVLPRGLGRVELTDAPTEADLMAVLAGL